MAKRDGSIRYPASEADPGDYLIGAATLVEINSVLHVGFSLVIRDHSYVVLDGGGNTPTDRLLAAYRKKLRELLGPTRFRRCTCHATPFFLATDTDYEIRNGVVYCVSCEAVIGDAQ